MSNINEEQVTDGNLYELILKSIKNYAVFMIDLKGVINYCNEAAAKLRGYTVEEIIGKSYSIFYLKEDIESNKPEKDLLTAKETGKFEEANWRLRKDETSFWASISIFPIYDKKNILIGYSDITRDLSTLKSLESDLQKREEQAQLMISGVKDYAIFMLDTKGNILTWNEGAKRIKGYSAYEAIGKNFSIFYTQEDLNAGKPAMELVVAAKEGVYEEEGWRVKKNGETFWANVLITALYNDMNELVGYSKVTRDLTERKSAEEDLKKSEEQYRLLVSGVRDYAIFLIDENGKIKSWNKGAAQINGYAENEIIGKNFSIFYSKEDLMTDKPNRELKLALQHGKCEEEGWRVRKNGEKYYASELTTPIYKEGEKKVLIGFSKIVKDLTEKKLAELDYKTVEESYRLLVDSVKDYAIFTIDPKGYILSWNEGAKNIKGYTSSEIIGKHFSIFYPIEDIENKKPEMELEVALKKGKYEEEGWRIKKNGSRFWANIIISPVFDAQGKHIGFSKVTSDLSEKKAAEENLKAREQQYKFLLNSVKDYGIFMLNEEGRIISWNEGAKRIQGYEADEIIGKYFSIFYPPEDKAKPTYELKEAIKKGRFEDEGWRMRKDGSRFWSNVIITPVYNEQNNLIGFSKVTRDLTERRAQEKKLKESEEKFRTMAEALNVSNHELMNTNMELEQFTTVASHDLQEPLRTITSYLTLLDKKVEVFKDPESEMYIKRTIEAGMKMKSLILNLLEYSRLTKEEKKFEPINVESLLSDCLLNLKGSIESSNAVIKIENELGTVNGNKVQLGQLIQNLVSNGIKFQNVKTPEIIIKAYKLDGQDAFSVRDNGIGIPKQYLDKIFEIFKRLHSKSEYPGTGIGLAICKKIVEKHGGEIWAESEPGEGTTFHFTINTKA